MRTMEQRQQTQQEALSRATSGATWSNYPAIFAGFTERGLPESEIKPRENVFTFDAWKALGRHVRKGEHGIRVQTWISIPPKVDEQTGETKPGGRRPKSAVVFHVSQTDPNA